MMKPLTSTQSDIEADLKKRFRVLMQRNMHKSPTINYDIMLAFLNVAESIAINCDDYCFDGWDVHFQAVREGMLQRQIGWAKLCGISLNEDDI